MSTTPTEVLETIASTLATEPIAPTAATEAGFDFDAIKGLMDNFDPASLLPDLSTIFGWVVLICRIAVLVGPIVLAALGIAYLFFSPKEANWYFGYRTYFGMGSVQAWPFTQRLSGIVLGVLGVILIGVALVISGRFPGMDINDMVWLALKLLIVEGVLAIVANAAIGITAMARFDRKGEYRGKKK